MGEGSGCVVLIIGAVVGIAVLLVVILVPMSFSDLEYYEVSSETFVVQQASSIVKCLTTSNQSVCCHLIGLGTSSKVQCQFLNMPKFRVVLLMARQVFHMTKSTYLISRCFI